MAAAAELASAHPKIGLFLLECSNIPPQAQGHIQGAMGRPIFDFTTLIGLYQTASFRWRFSTWFY